MLDIRSSWLSVFSDGIRTKTDTSPQPLRNAPQLDLAATSSCKYLRVSRWFWVQIPWGSGAFSVLSWYSGMLGDGVFSPSKITKRV